MSEREDDASPEQLLRRAQAGDRDALGQLLELYRHYLGLLAQIQLRPAPRQALSASDAVQEAFLNAHASFRQFRGGTEREFVAWLRRILASSIVNLARRRFGRRHTGAAREHRLGDLLDESSQLIDGLVARDVSPSSVAARRERAVLFANAMHQLPEHYSQVLILRHVDGLQFAEIARQLGRSVNSVEKIWIRAINQLRRLLT